MPTRTDTFDLARLSLTPGEGRRFEIHVAVDPFELSGEPYRADQELVPARFDVARMTGNGYSLRLRFDAALKGPCMRCLDPARVSVEVDAREVDQPGSGEELESPYVAREALDVRAWAHDALGLALPARLLCRPDCAGLCPVCGANLNSEPGHAHERTPDPRWSRLGELKLD